MKNLIDMFTYKCLYSELKEDILINLIMILLILHMIYFQKLYSQVESKKSLISI